MYVFFLPPHGSVGSGVMDWVLKVSDGVGLYVCVSPFCCQGENMPPRLTPRHISRCHQSTELVLPQLPRRPLSSYFSVITLHYLFECDKEKQNVVADMSD